LVGANHYAWKFKGTASINRTNEIRLNVLQCFFILNKVEPDKNNKCDEVSAFNEGIEGKN
jgi:hypothetical protein